MRIVLLLGFEEKEVVSGDLLMMQERYGQDETIVLKPIYPKTQAEHTLLCKGEGVVAVLLLEHRFCIVPDAAARMLVPHILFSARSGERMGYQAISIDVRLSPAMMKQQQAG